MLLEFPLKNLGQLILVAGLSVAETVKQYAAAAKVQLKWPNDVLLNGAKVCGMLLEKGEGNYMVVGIGVNVAQSPQTGDMLYPTTSLKEAGIAVSAADFLDSYLRCFAANEQLHAAELRQRWLQNVYGLGEKIVVRQENGQLCGYFAGIDENADLLLRNGDEIKRVLAGDVFYIKDEK